MSDINDDSRRTRRRAVRTAGPPVEDAVDAGSTDAGVPADAETTTVKPSAADSADSTSVATQATSGEPAAAKRSAAGKSAVAGETAKPKPSAAKKGPDEHGTGDDSDEAATVVLSKSVDAEQTIAGEDAASTGSYGAHLSVTRRIVLVAAAAMLIAVLAAGAVISVFTVRSVDRQADRRTEYVQTAEQAILNLTTINADTAKEDIDRILSLASGKFKTEFDGRVDPFLTIVQQAEVRATGEIIEAALESDEENSAKVLVAAKQSLTNAGQEGPQTRYYRFRVTVSESDSGLTASNVEFVP